MRSLPSFIRLGAVRGKRANRHQDQPNAIGSTASCKSPQAIYTRNCEDCNRAQQAGAGETRDQEVDKSIREFNERRPQEKKAAPCADSRPNSASQRNDAMYHQRTSGVAARWADRLIYLKTVSETRAQLTFGRQRYVQTSGGEACTGIFSFQQMGAVAAMRAAAIR